MNTPPTPSSATPSARRSFSSGVLWNMGSFFIMGVSGVLLNVIIAHAYSPDTLGVFNQVFAFYIMTAQLSVLGIHYSVLRQTALLSEEEPTQAGKSAQVALWLVAGLSAVVSSSLWLLKGTVATWLQSPALALGLAAVSVGMFLFPLNKVLLSCLNGFQRMRAYAIGNGMRYILIILAVLVMAQSDWPGYTLPAAFSVSEALLFVGLLAANPVIFQRFSRAEALHWAKSHLQFGSRGFLAGLFAELNTRIDILVLGYYLSDAQVGLYSFVAILAEGVLQLLTVLRANYDPLLARLTASRGWDTLRATFRQGSRLAYLLMGGGGLAGLALYPVVVGQWIGLETAYLEVWPVLAILLGGIILSAGYIPFGGILQQAGHPGTQSLLIFLGAMINLVGNVLLIPHLGLVGAALATALAQVASVGLLLLFVRLRLKISL